MTVLLFYKDVKTGGIEIWPGKEELQHKDDRNKHINGLRAKPGEPTTVNPKKYTAVVFDARTLNRSLAHNINAPGVVFAFQMSLNGRECRERKGENEE